MKFPVNDIINLLDDRLELNLAESTNKDLILEEIWDEAFSQGLKKLKLEYGTSQGNEELRELVSQKLEVDKKNIVITNGSAFGNFLSMLCLCDTGDEVITVQPNFPPMMDLIEGLGFKKKLLKLSFEEKYQLNEEELFKTITEKTKLIILVSPLNPTGTTLSRAEVEKISIRLNDEYPNCRLLIDETYREATYGNNEVIPTFAGLKNNIITVSSLSKCHGTPGLRIGWLYSSDANFIKEVSIAKVNTVITNSVLDEYVATQVLKKETEIFQARRIQSAKGLELTKKWVELNEQFIKWNEPSAGALCCIKLKETIFGQEQIEQFYSLSKHAGIQIASGEWFGETNRCFRLGFGYMEIKQLIKTLEKLTEIIKVTVTNKELL
ncbi:pyridoxal phosphate-dependent aminotransferase [Maribacter halichondriae]|uniref:pyridoxal phosphate-dependent aminotransferase n=1 Tax=Maribacter halichondriae TaxID=2980554 RepID=UPI00235880F8|nr:pyridoxal phosphate-dependent aminotransferase [Maribacter sp. Hal144]